MDKSEIIERLRRIADHAVHTVGEAPFVMSLDDGIAVREAIELLEKAETIKWIPFKTRPLTEEEKEENPDCDEILDCELPDDNEEILVTVRYKNGKRKVYEDTFFADDGYYLDSGYYFATEAVAWARKPEPYKEGE